MGEAARQDASLAHDLLHHEAQVQRKGLVVAHEQHRPRGRQRAQAALHAAVLVRGEEHRARQPLDGRRERPGRDTVSSRNPSVCVSAFGLCFEFDCFPCRLPSLARLHPADISTSVMYSTMKVRAMRKLKPHQPFTMGCHVDQGRFPFFAF